VDLRDVVDAALEISIVGSFSRVGYASRRRLYRWSDPNAGGLAGSTILITGPTSGLGLATARTCARLGARIVLVGRSEERLASVRKGLAERHGDDRAVSVVADMSSLASVRRAVARVRDMEPRLDVIIDNAGAINGQRRITDDGIEATFATTVVGPFVLVSGLLPLLAASERGRVISTVSGGMYAQSLPLDDLGYARGPYDGTRAYARAKRAQTAMVREWARRIGRGGTRFNAMHPGWADTPGLEASLPAFHRLMVPMLRTPAEGIDTLIWLASDASAGSRGGELFVDRRARPFDRVHATRLDPVARRDLWDQVVALSGSSDPTKDILPLRD
jgi:dehydrogenase/reductase SDR family protein 12